MLFHEGDDPPPLPRSKPAAMAARLWWPYRAAEAQKLMGQHPAECLGIEMAGRIVAADLCLELDDGLPEAAVLEQHPGLKISFIEVAIGMDSDGGGVDVDAYGPRQLSRILPAEKLPSRRDQDELVGAAARGRRRQSFHKKLAVMSCTLLDGHKEVMLVFEPILEALMADDLNCLNVHSVPACQFVPDDLGRREIDHC